MQILRKANAYFAVELKVIQTLCGTTSYLNQLILRTVLLAAEGQHNYLSYYKIEIRAGIRTRDIGQLNILVPLIKRTTSFSYFYGSEWKMVIYEYQMPKTSCFLSQILHSTQLSLSVLVPRNVMFFQFSSP